jgi:UDP-N-acetylmuramate: L-alanyl-gamma-D-glutamyl-meso-diaminopimelate ligase
VATISLDEGQEQAMSVFGSHNLLNADGAIAVCELLGIDRAAGYRALADFTGAARRLELITKREGLIAYRDFAHAPSKLKATLEAVREAWPGHYLVACFELHTYSSLSPEFLSQYQHSMHPADKAFVYYSHHALSIKGLADLEPGQAAAGFGSEDVTVLTTPELLKQAVGKAIAEGKAEERQVCLLVMSSGTFDGIDWNAVSSQ